MRTSSKWRLGHKKPISIQLGVVGEIVMAICHRDGGFMEKGCRHKIW